MIVFLGGSLTEVFVEFPVLQEFMPIYPLVIWQLRINDDEISV